MPKVLLAEDDQTMILLLKTLLKMEGFEVDVLSADADVPAMVKREKPDILLMDVHLGGQNGLEITKALRSDAEIGHVRIVMTSGMNLKDECLQSGADRFLLKPFMPDDLINALKEQSEPL